MQGLANLQFLYCSNNQIPFLNVQGLANLQGLDCSNNQLPSLNVQELTNLQSLNCGNNQLPSLNVQGLTNLQYLSCYTNQLPSLNIQGLANLQGLDCSNNQIPFLNVQGLTNLQSLYCGNNQLTSLNVQELSNVYSFDCSNNQISTLDLPFSPINLNFLDCSNNQLTKLDIQGSGIISLDCSNNQLTELFIKKFFNIGIWDIFDFNNNPNLAFICANEEDFSLVQTNLNGNTNCQVASDCSLSVVNNPLDNDYFSIYPNPVKNELNLSIKQAIIIYSLSIYNTLGQQVQTTTNSEKTIDVNGLKTGNYIMKFTTDKGRLSSKFVKD